MDLVHYDGARARVARLGTDDKVSIVETTRLRPGFMVRIDDGRDFPGFVSKRRGESYVAIPMDCEDVGASLAKSLNGFHYEDEDEFNKAVVLLGAMRSQPDYGLEEVKALLATPEFVETIRTARTLEQIAVYERFSRTQRHAEERLRQAVAALDEEDILAMARASDSKRVREFAENVVAEGGLDVLRQVRLDALKEALSDRFIQMAAYESSGQYGKMKPGFYDALEGYVRDCERVAQPAPTP